MTNRVELMRLVKGGEDTYLELKVKFSNVEKLTAEIIALANTDGGALIFGINDQLRIEGVDDPEHIEAELRNICAQEILPPIIPYINKVAFDSGRRIVVLEVEPNRRPHHNRDFQYFLREGSIKRETSREELSELYGESPNIGFEQVPVITSSIADIDESLFWSFMRSVNGEEWERNDKGFPTGAMLRDLGLGMQNGEQIIPNVAGLLLFGRPDRLASILPQAKVTLTRYAGDNLESPVIEQSVIQGNLLRLFEGTVNFARRYSDLLETRPPRRPAGADLAPGSYHENSILEGIVNALVHRDWNNIERPARVNIFENSIEILNPMQRHPLSVKTIRYGVSRPRNPALKTVFTNHHYLMRSVTRGIPAFFENVTAFSKKHPDYDADRGGEFRLRIPAWR